MSNRTLKSYTAPNGKTGYSYGGYHTIESDSGFIVYSDATGLALADDGLHINRYKDIARFDSVDDVVAFIDGIIL